MAINESGARLWPCARRIYGHARLAHHQKYVKYIYGICHPCILQNMNFAEILLCIIRIEGLLLCYNLYFRLSYAVFILRRMKQMYPERRITVMYDIACVLDKHLKVIYNAFISNLDLFNYNTRFYSYATKYV